MGKYDKNNMNINEKKGIHELVFTIYLLLW